jgi:hypothetical protein
MKSQYTTGRKRHKEYKDPRTFLEAERRLIDLSTDIKLIDAQLADPGSRDGRSPKKHKAWRTRTIKAKAYKEREIRLIKLWKVEERNRLRIRLMRFDGINDPHNPMCMLAHLLNVTEYIIEEKHAEHMLSDEQWRVIDQSRDLLIEEEYGRQSIHNDSATEADAKEVPATLPNNLQRFVD